LAISVFAPWLQPGEQKQLKAIRLQPLKGLNAKAAKETEKENHRAEAPVKKDECFLSQLKTLNLSYILKDNMCLKNNIFTNTIN